MRFRDLPGGARSAIIIGTFVAWAVLSGWLMVRADRAVPSLMEAEHAACEKKCSPRAYRLETQRTERAYQNSWRPPPAKYPECICE